MKLARGPRPWSVRLFSALFVGVALISLVRRLSDPVEFAFVIDRCVSLQTDFEDAGIIAASALFSVACMPVALIWFRASRIARILIGVMAGLQLFRLPDLFLSWPYVPPVELIVTAVPLIGLILLFTPSANRWIAMKGRRESDAIA